MKAIALVNGNKRIQTTVVPIYYLNMSAFLSSNGIDNDIIEIKEYSNKVRPIDYYDNQLLKKIKQDDYEYIGISMFTNEYHYTMNLIKKIKETFPLVKIILGGVHPTLKPADCFISKAPVDIVVRGEGEYPLLEILQKNPLREIKGICFKEDGEIIQTDRRSLSNDLSYLPIPAYDKIDMEYYLYPTKWGLRFAVTSCIHFFTAFGCPFNCTFCATASIYKAQGGQRLVRYKSVDQVIEEIKFCKNKYDIESCYFQDDTFTINQKRAHDICSRLIDEKLHITWGAETRVNCIDDELIEKMKKSGCVQLDFGVEAATDTALKRMKKGTTIKQVEDAFDLCKRHGIRTGANFMLNTPGETQEDVEELGGFMRRIDATTYLMGLTVPFIGSDIFDKYVGDLSIDEYKLYENPYLFGTIIDKRFKLSAHNLPVEKYLLRLRLRFWFKKFLVDFPMKKWYLIYLIKSKYKGVIFKVLVHNMLIVTYDSFEFIVKFVLRNILNLKLFRQQ
ncbi:MAG: radical SAM protein [Nitrospirae bacterium]|nr:radical SAM protein [Nitrospirota bacterium]